MGLFTKEREIEKDRSGILGAFSVDLIKWEPKDDSEASVIVHKFEAEDFPNGSQLIVGPSQMAIFVNNLLAGKSSEAGEGGQSQMLTFVGPCKIKLETGDSRFLPFRNISHKLTGGESAFHSAVYFVNTTYMNELNWGTQDPILVEDPEEQVNVHVRAFGLFGVHIEQNDNSVAVLHANRFLRKVVGTRAEYTRRELTNFMRAKILEYVPDLLAKAMVDRQVGILKISTYLKEFSNIIQQELAGHFEDFGLTLDQFSFHSINAPEEDLRAINDMKIAKKRAKLEAEAAAAKMDIESEAMARKREREGYTYQQEHGFEVMNTAAGNTGTASGLMGAGMGLGMGFGIGGAMNAGFSQMAQNTLGAVNNPAQQSAAPAATIVCPACGEQISGKSKFCPACGEKIVPKESIVCPECGETLPAGAKFCPSCGHKMITKCPACGAVVTGNSKFCAECGQKL